MKKFTIVLVSAVVIVTMWAGFAAAKASFKKDLGIDDCNKCHVADKKAANDSNSLWKKAKEHSAKLVEGRGDFYGKRTCNDCHHGMQKPPKGGSGNVTPPPANAFPPSIQTVAPPQAVAGSTVKIYGNGFSQRPELFVYFTGISGKADQQAQILARNDVGIDVIVPNGARSGRIGVVVGSGANAQSAISSFAIAITNRPASATPRNQIPNGGKYVAP